MTKQRAKTKGREHHGEVLTVPLRKEKPGEIAMNNTLIIGLVGRRPLEGRVVASAFQWDRPHSALGNLAPREFAASSSRVGRAG